MFNLEGKLTFINIDEDYVKALHEACTEVYYKAGAYKNKPYIGILINNEDRKYVIPLTSAKEKHKQWKDIDKGCYLIYEMAKKSNMGEQDIWTEVAEDSVKHILSVADIKKMIPIADGTYQKVDINPNSNDSDSIKKYKDLLNKEYSFCLKIIDELVDKASKLYEKQMKTNTVSQFCCTFKTLEEVADKWVQITTTESFSPHPY